MVDTPVHLQLVNVFNFVNLNWKSRCWPSSCFEDIRQMVVDSVDGHKGVYVVSDNLQIGGGI